MRLVCKFCHLHHLPLLSNLALTMPLVYLCKGVRKGGVRFPPPSAQRLGQGCPNFLTDQWLLGHVCQHTAILRKYYSNQCGLTIPPICSFLRHCRYWRNFSAEATFHKEVLNHCRHDGFPCQKDTLHGILDIHFFFTSFSVTSPSISHNKKHTRCLRYTRFTQWCPVPVCV